MNYALMMVLFPFFQVLVTLRVATQTTSIIYTYGRMIFLLVSRTLFKTRH
jgi:hypothetical protein